MLKRSLVLGAACSVAVVGLTAGSAVAAPYSYQKFDAKALCKAGTKKKPRSCGVYLHPFHVNDDKAKTGAISESPPFATVFADIYYPKAMKLTTKGFPECAFDVVLNTPDNCPKGSEIGDGDAAGYARPQGAGPGVGGLVPLTQRTFILGSNRIALRAKGAVTGVLRGDVSKATGSMAKKYGQKIRFTIPIGLIAPLGPSGGLVSQLVTFDGTIKAQSWNGKPLMTLGACPKNKKLAFAYVGFYNIDLATGPGPDGLGTTSPENGSLQVSAKSKPVVSTSKCRK